MKKDYTAEEYNQYVAQKSPKSSIVKDTVLAFLIGGLICLLGECLSQWLKSTGIGEETAKKAVPIILIFLGSFLTGINVYNKIGKHAGAGTIVPITGFANSIVSSAMEFKSEGLVLGMAAKMFTIAGPVIVYGTVVSVAIGLIYCFFI